VTEEVYNIVKGSAVQDCKRNVSVEYIATGEPGGQNVHKLKTKLENLIIPKGQSNLCPLRILLTLMTANTFWKVMLVRKIKRAPLMFMTPSWFNCWPK